MKIDDKTVVPLKWLLGGFGVGLVPVITSTLWIASVNSRLERIEEKLGIHQVSEKKLITEIPVAEANDRPK